MDRLQGAENLEKAMAVTDYRFFSHELHNDKWMNMYFCTDLKEL